MCELGILMACLIGTEEFKTSVRAQLLDSDLIGAVRRATVLNISIDEIEKKVGVKAVFISLRKGDRDYVCSKFCPITCDDTEMQLSELDEAVHFAIWRRPIKSRFNSHKVIVILWDRTNRSRHYFATVLPSD